MNDWWQQQTTDIPTTRRPVPTGEPAAAVKTGTRRDSADRTVLGALGANTLIVGATAGVLAPAVGVTVASIINGRLLSAQRQLHLGVRTVAVAFLVGALLAGWAPFTAGQRRLGLRRGAVAGTGTAVVAATFLPLADHLWQASRADGGPGSLLVLIGAWVVIGGLAGAVAGIEDGAIRARNGLIGGLAGGMVGGLCFAALSGDFRITEESSFLSQLAGYTATGLGIGLGVGITERLARTAWLVAIDGPQAGREFILYRDRTLIGAADDCEVYLGPDPEVEARHARLTRIGDRLELHQIDGPVELDRQPFEGGPVADGSVVRIGRSYLRVELRTSATDREPTDIRRDRA